MKIRALTGFIDPGSPVDETRIASLAVRLKNARQALIDDGYDVQTLRLAAPAPAKMDPPLPPQERLEFARQLEYECAAHAIDYASIGPALPEELQGYSIIPDVLAATENIFASGIFADSEGGISLAAAHACAQTIKKASTITADGFANLRFAALANVAPGAPFFPASYHQGESPALAVAVEGASVAVDAFENAASPAIARRLFIEAIERHTAAITNSIERSLSQHNIRFLGIDFSLAPYPEKARSIGTAIENLGVPRAGLAGSVAAAAFLTDCLDQARFTRTGFCGLFMPVLEDSILAQRAAEGCLTITDLLLYSTVCGAGLDTIPLPGNTTAEAIAALLVDVGALALRHNKPLTARLMPIPGKQSGDAVHFDFDYFADSAVMSLPAKPLGGLLGSNSILVIGRRSV